MPYNIRCNLLSDLNECAKQELERKGFKLSDSDKISIFEQYLNVIKHTVTPQRRTVHIPQDLKCPPEHQEGFDRLIDAVKSGININPYLSKNTLDAGAMDGMLLDFGLHHFHLGVSVEQCGPSAGLMKRTGPILIALVKTEDFYCVAIKNHGRDFPLLWTHKSLIEILHNHWPDLIQQYKVLGFRGLSDELTDKDRKSLRQKNLNSFIKLDDGMNLPHS